MRIDIEQVIPGDSIHLVARGVWVTVRDYPKTHVGMFGPEWKVMCEWADRRGYVLFGEDSTVEVGR